MGQCLCRQILCTRWWVANLTGSRALRTFHRLRLEKHRIRPLHRWAVERPAVALAQVVGWLGDLGLGAPCQFVAVPLASRQGLVGGSRHVEQKLSQVGAALGAAHVFVDDLAPARAHGLADQFVHAVRCACAFGVRDVVHRGGDVLDHHPVVERDPDSQAVDAFVGREGALIDHLEVVGFDVAQFGFDVPQAIFAVVALVGHGSRM